MYNIVILSEKYNFHDECLGFLLEMFNSVEYNIELYLNPNCLSNWPRYYETLYSIKAKNINELNLDMLNKYLHVILLTNYEPISCLKYIKDKNKIISIVHSNKLKSAIGGKNISLSPYVKGILYSQIFTGITTPISDKKNWLIHVGSLAVNYPDNDHKDFEYFMKNLKYTIYWCNRKPPPKWVADIKNVIIKIKLEASELVKILTQCKYIICRKLPYQPKTQYSGSYSLGLSHGVPLILQEELKTAYGFPALTFKKDYAELLDHLNNLSDANYQNDYNAALYYRKQQIDLNKTIWRNMMN